MHYPNSGDGVRGYQQFKIKDLHQDYFVKPEERCTFKEAYDALAVVTKLLPSYQGKSNTSYCGFNRGIFGLH